MCIGGDGVTNDCSQGCGAVFKVLHGRVVGSQPDQDNGNQTNGQECCRDSANESREKTSAHQESLIPAGIRRLRRCQVADQAPACVGVA